MPRSVTYLDNAATSWPKPPEVLEAVIHYHNEMPASAGRGGYREAVAAGRMLDELRVRIAGLLGGSRPERVVFALNGTDALNLGIQGVVQPGDHVVTTAIDHNSVLRPLHHLTTMRGVTLTVVPVSAQGIVDPEAVHAAFTPRTRLVVMTHASNVTGAIQPTAEVARLAHAHHALFLLDAAQTFGAIPVDVRAIPADLVAFPGHKAALGPQGTGVLWMRDGVNVAPLRQGGTGSRSDLAIQPDFLPDRLEPGAHNGPGLAGLLAAVKFIESVGVETIAARRTSVTERLLDVLRAVPGCRILGPPDAEARTAIVSAVFDGHDAAHLARELDDRAGIKVRGGLHCAPYAHRALGSFEGGAVRFAPGWFTTDAEIDLLASTLVALCGAPRVSTRAAT